MRKIGYGLIGILLGVILYILMLIKVPISAEVKSTLIEFDIYKQHEEYEEYVADDFFGGDIIPFNEYGSYHVSVADFKNYEVNGIVKYGKVNPMFYFLKPTPEPEVSPDIPNIDIYPEQPNNIPIMPPDEVPGNENTQPGGLITPDEKNETIYKGFNINTRLEEDKDVTHVINKFKQYGRLPVEHQLYNISSSFGRREDPFGAGAAFHTGLDIAKTGIYKSNVYAVIHGEVIAVKSDPEGYGNYIVLEHGGFSTLYAHLDKLPTMVPGTKVYSGDVLGSVGSTGRSTGPHLHFEIIVDEVRFNPAPFLSETRKVD